METSDSKAEERSGTAGVRRGRQEEELTDKLSNVVAGRPMGWQT